MHSSWDQFLIQRERKKNLLRVEQVKRAMALKTSLRKYFLKALKKESSLTKKNHQLINHITHKFSKQATKSKVNSICRYTGRSRHVWRSTQLSRMQKHLALSEGRLTFARHGRT